MTIKQFQNDPYEQYTRKVVSAESGGKTTARNKFGAAGLYQFVPSTWRTLNDKYKLGYSQDDRLDPEKSKKVMRIFTEENKKILSKRLGRQPDDYELYLAHGFGAGGASSFLKALSKNPNTKTTEFFSKTVLNQNPYLFNKDGSPRTLGDISNHYKEKMSLPASNYKNSEKALPKEEIVPLSIEVNNKLTDLAFSKELPNFAGQSYTPDEEADKDIQKLEEKEAEKQELPPLQTTQQPIVYETAPVREDISQDYIDANQTYAEIEQFVQMQNGGYIYVSNENDPRYRKYQDSLFLYEANQKLKKAIQKDPVAYMGSIRNIDNSNNGKNFNVSRTTDEEENEIRGINPISYTTFNNIIANPIKGRPDINTKVSVGNYKKPEQKVIVDPIKAGYSSKVVISKRDDIGSIPKMSAEGILQDYNNILPESDSNINGNYQPTTFNISEYNQRMNGMQGYGSGRQDTNADILKAERALDYQNAYNNYIERTYNNPQSRNNPKAQERYETLRNYLDINPNYQQGGFTYKRPEYQNTTVKDNIPQRLRINEGELLRELEDLEELKKTGKIARPRSARYRLSANSTRPQQPQLSQSSQSREESLRDREAMRNVTEGSMSMLQRPLVYLANPLKIAGDLFQPLVGETITNNPFPTSEEDRQQILLNQYNPYQTQTDRRVNNLQEGLGYVPEASLNLALGATAVGEKATVGNLLNQTLNPVATTAKTVNKPLQRVLEENPELAKIGSLEQYEQYIQNIYPNSQNKEIYYHGGKRGIDEFKDLETLMAENAFKGNRFNRGSDKNVKGIYFTGKRNSADAYSKIYNKEDRQTYSVLLDMQNPYQMKSSMLGKKPFDPYDINTESYEMLKNLNNDSVNFANSEYIIFNPQQAHILGSSKDLEGFKNYVGYRDGGQIPTTPLGLWQYPKQIVRVPTDGSITMSQVPYEVLGISEQTGERIKMLPNQKYFFKDTNSVIEIPQLK